MERDYNYMGGYITPQLPMTYPMWQIETYPQMMQQNTLGQCCFGREVMPYLMKGNCNLNNAYSTVNNYPGMIGSNNMQAIDDLETDMHKFILTKINFEIGNFVTVNMGKMPYAVSKDKYLSMVNNVMTELVKDETKLKEMLKTRCTEEMDKTRGFCPFCFGMLKTTVELMLLTQLIRRGCTFCY